MHRKRYVHYPTRTSKSHQFHGQQNINFSQFIFKLMVEHEQFTGVNAHLAPLWWSLCLFNYVLHVCIYNMVLLTMIVQDPKVHSCWLHNQKKEEYFLFSVNTFDFTVRQLCHLPLFLHFSQHSQKQRELHVRNMSSEFLTGQRLHDVPEHQLHGRIKSLMQRLSTLEETREELNKQTAYRPEPPQVGWNYMIVNTTLNMILPCSFMTYVSTKIYKTNWKYL